FWIAVRSHVASYIYCPKAAVELEISTENHFRFRVPLQNGPCMKMALCIAIETNYPKNGVEFEIIKPNKRIKRHMKKPNTNRVVVGSDKGLTDLQEKLNVLKSKGILKGYEEQDGIRGAAIPSAPLGRVYY